MDIAKLESISKIIAAVFIPLAIAYMANGLSEDNKKIDTQAKLVEIATGILAKEVTPNATDDTKAIRRWAVDVINRFSGVKMEVATQQALVNTTSLPLHNKSSSDDSGPWGVVFGSDKSKPEAEWELKKAKNKFNADGLKIYLREGSYRSVQVYSTRSEAEEGLGKLKLIRDNSYIVDISKWCQNPLVVDRQQINCR